MVVNSQIVILGHSGFIGSQIERSLQCEGFKVIGKSLPEVDLSDVKDMSKIEMYFTPETTLILAAAVKRQFGDSLESFKLNIAIVENICKILIEKPVKRVIFFSSTAVYGEETNNTNISEETSVNPTSFYGISKYTSERLLEKVISLHPDSSLICLRPPLIYGPGDKGKTYGPAGFAYSVKNESILTLWGDGTELREFLFIEDLCRIMNKLCTIEFSGVINLVSGKSASFVEIIDLLRVRFPNLNINQRKRSKKKADNCFNGSKLRSILGPDFLFTSLNDGLQETLQHKE